MFSRNWMEPSEEAKKEGMCHTKQECRQMYDEISSKKKSSAILCIVNSDINKYFGELVVNAFENNGNPVYDLHFGFGMAFRNFLRKNGFGEKFFGIDNLDCIYEFLLADAINFFVNQTNK